MSVTTDITVWCDHPSCMDWTYGDGAPQSTIREARAAAKRVGWTHTKRFDFCREHQFAALIVVDKTNTKRAERPER
jgi:hypothetical protein